MTDLYIPQLKDTIRLTEDLVVTDTDMENAYGGHQNQGPKWRIVRGDAPYDYTANRNIDGFTLVAGTVLQFRRYFVSSYAQKNDVEVSIFAHPRPDLTPKKNGGKGQMIKLVFPTTVMNRIKYEKVNV